MNDQPSSHSSTNPSSTVSDTHSQSSHSTVASSLGPKTPPFQQNDTFLHNADYMQDQNLNPNPDLYYQGQPGAPPPVPSNGLTQYHQPPPPPMMQPAHPQYPAPSPYGQYGYGTGLTSPPSAGPVATPIPMTQHVLPLPSVTVAPGTMPNYSGFDTTGQVAPPGVKPRVTATLWEDEGSLCFQVEARGICVARREDNHMINGTKLLNVAGMTRGRRDGILKSEKIRHVVKIGPMHLKGVWIPFDRALDFANKEKITELLFPLFVNNIHQLLYHPTNQSRTSAVVAAAERRKAEQQAMRGQPGGLGMMGHPQQTLASHAAMTTPGRPSMDRSHTFPTPPTSASGVMGGSMSASEPFAWPHQGHNGSMGMDTGLSNRSMPATPATTPPGAPLQSMHYPATTQAYDSRSLYHQHPHQHTPASASSQHAHHAQHTPATHGQHGQHGQHAQHGQQPTPVSHSHHQQHQHQHHGQVHHHNSPHERSLYHSHGAQASATTGAYIKSEMSGSEPVRTASMGGPGDGHDHKVHVHDDEHEHEAEYTHDSNAYDANRNPYNYTAPAPAVATLTSDHQLQSVQGVSVQGVQGVQGVSSDVAHGATHGTTGSGRSTPRSVAASQPYAYAQPGYSTPPRVPSSAAATATAAAAQASSNLYNIVSNDRAANSAGAGQDVYGANPADMGYANTQGLATTPPGSAGIKRCRDDDDDERNADLKRRKTLMDPVMPSSAYDPAGRPLASANGAQRHR